MQFGGLRPMHAPYAITYDPIETLTCVARVNILQMGPNRPILSGSLGELRGDLARFHDLGIEHVFADLNFAPTPIDEILAYMGRLREAAA
jgi:hypothetical protein